MQNYLISVLHITFVSEATGSVDPYARRLFIFMVSF